MIQDMQAVQSDIEGNFHKLQPVIEQTAIKLYKLDSELMTRYLTDYSVGQGELVVERWRELGEHLIVKYNDGYVKDENGRPQGKGYPESWQEEVLRARPEQFRLPVKKEEVPESKLVD